jgi:DNA-binding transcriptional regulator of glucitol operon
MTVWILLGAVVAGWMLQLWLTMRQSRAYLRAVAQLRRSGTVATGKGGRRYRGGVAFVSLATDGKRVTGAVSLKGFTTFARPAPLPALTGMRLGAVAGDRPIPGLTDSERDAAREAVRMLRAADRTVESTAGTSSPGAKGVRIPTGAVPPA